jgi:hypothetical protein
MKKLVPSRNRLRVQTFIVAMIAEATNIMHHVVRMSLRPLRGLPFDSRSRAIQMRVPTLIRLTASMTIIGHARHRCSDAGSGRHATWSASSSARASAASKYRRGRSCSTVASCSSFSASLVHLGEVAQRRFALSLSLEGSGCRVLSRRMIASVLLTLALS